MKRSLFDNPECNVCSKQVLISEYGILVEKNCNYVRQNLKKYKAIRQEIHDTRVNGKHCSFFSHTKWNNVVPEWCPLGEGEE